MKCVYRVHTWDFRSKFIEIIQDDCNQSAVCMCVSWDYSADILRRVSRNFVAVVVIIFNGRLSIKLKWQLMHSSGTNTVHRPLFLPSAFAHNEIYLFHAHAFAAIRRAFYRRFQSKTYFTKINSDFNYGISFHFGWIVYVCSVNMCTLYIIAGCLCVRMCAFAHSPPL